MVPNNVEACFPGIANETTRSDLIESSEARPLKNLLQRITRIWVDTKFEKYISHSNREFFSSLVTARWLNLPPMIDSGAVQDLQSLATIYIFIINKETLETLSLLSSLFSYR